MKRENTLKIELNRLSETIENESVKLDKNTLIDNDKIRKMIEDGSDIEIHNEYLSEIFDTGKHFNFPYQFDRKAYAEFISKNDPKDWFNSKKSENGQKTLLDIEGDIYVRLDLEIIESENWENENSENSIDIKMEIWTSSSSDDKTCYDYFFIPVNTDEEKAKAIEVIFEATKVLGKPDLNKKGILLDREKKNLNRIESIIDKISSIA